MKISIISDTHFGYKWNTERQEDSFRNAEEAFEKAEGSDLVLMPGDLFNNKIPKPEVLDRATEILSIPENWDKTVETEDISLREGTPVVAIHGTHERRAEKYTNPLELLDNTGLIHHLNDETMVFEKNGEKAAIHGMGGVPERKAKKKMKELDFEPVEDAFNILMLHQSIEGLVYTPKDEDYLKPEDLPEGFDLIVNGHIHWYNLERFPDAEKPLVLPGSTVTTQMRKVEAEKDKGFLQLDTEKEEIMFQRLEQPRKVHYIDLELNGGRKQATDRIIQRLEGIEAEKPPLVNLKLEGDAEGVDRNRIRQRFGKKMIINFNTSLNQEKPEETEELEALDALDEGIKVLRQKAGSDIDHENFLELLENGKKEEAEKKLRETIKDD